MLSIGDLSKRTGIKVPTIRFYEQRGLIAPPVRTAGNQRRYDTAVVERLLFLRHARELGLDLEAIEDLLALSENPQMSCGRAHEIAGNHLASIRQKIAQLQSLEAELQRITSQCASQVVGECLVLQALSDHGQCQGDHTAPSPLK
ncbi:MerR family transcriptional regulator [Polycladidibacter hongkongensis]|uniref:MerR family transcriptional regulator n=1 Tax=Polycladidibacter hongkongensis TaxID=1647556 RepID=UPI000829D4B5|nr:helix-turn-helix domain-containing protein [Pseudovibrio hongkongensis]